MINICLYEDDKYHFLYPLTYVKPSYDLLIGFDTLFDKFKRFFNYANITLHCRAHLKPIERLKHSEFAVNQINTGAPCLFINGRTILTEQLFEIITNFEQDRDFVLTHKGQVIAAYLSEKNLDFMKASLEKTPNNQTLIQNLRNSCVFKEVDEALILNFAHDLIELNEKMLLIDFNYRKQPGIIKGTINPFTIIYNENNVFVDKGTFIEDFVVLNAEQGPIYIEKNVYIESGTRLEGPLFIGHDSKILGGKIKTSTIGSHCKVSGEISQSIFFNFSNKAHSGFVGHSCLGEWANLGAGTTTSNLKNTYGPVKIDSHNGTINTQKIFLGAILGDHVKTGIGTLLTAGTNIGFGSNIYGPSIHDKFVLPFSWGEANNYQPYQMDQFVKTAKRVMLRRNVKLRPEHTQLFESSKQINKPFYDAP
ncbi:hypothetical protein HOH45_01190 [bacterium]|jgi:UDP-N-acetylglucosamine diphosphorylase / glucose-1-phosphate thymidylyltransferase / UDP-N-acetylgalactosamine diphosphorylase / glucosamine-1-phosphate N-acetyltransferase / galactosamine-1-phosphate N-acetyltransferase|nr:hypothetical protein [bacterium]